MLQDGVAWFHHSGNLWRNDGENVAQTSRNASTGFVPSNRLLQEQVLFILYFKTWAICIVEDRDMKYAMKSKTRKTSDVRG